MSSIISLILFLLLKVLQPGPTATSFDLVKHHLTRMSLFYNSEYSRDPRVSWPGLRWQWSGLSLQTMPVAWVTADGQHSVLPVHTEELSATSWHPELCHQSPEISSYTQTGRSLGPCSPSLHIKLQLICPFQLWLQLQLQLWPCLCSQSSALCF